MEKHLKQISNSFKTLIHFRRCHNISLCLSFCTLWGEECKSIQWQARQSQQSSVRCKIFRFSCTMIFSNILTNQSYSMANLTYIKLKISNCFRKCIIFQATLDCTKIGWVRWGGLTLHGCNAPPFWPTALAQPEISGWVRRSKCLPEPTPVWPELWQLQVIRLRSWSCS